MNIGELRERIEVFRMTTTPDGAGGTTGTLVKLGECWAKVTPLKASRYLQASQVSTAQEYEIHTRWRADWSLTVNGQLDTSILIKHRGTDITVKSVQNADFRSKVYTIFGTA